MSVRGSFPGGRAGAVVAIAALAPVVIRKAKPLAKALGNSLIWAGKTINDLAEEPKGTEAKPKTPKEDVNASRTTKTKRKVAGVDVTTASPTGQEEMSEQLAAEAAGDGATPKPVQPKPKSGKAGRKKVEPDQPMNPKRTRNSRKS